MMLRAKVAVVLSLLACSSIIFAALLSTSAMQGEVSHYKNTDWLGLFAISAFLIWAISWPWKKAFLLAAKPEGKIQAIAFSLIAVVIAGLFYSPILHAPAEGVGYNVIFCILVIWVSYPISKAFSA